MTAATCPDTTWLPSNGVLGAIRVYVSTCGRPLAPGARLCAVHEADRVRLGGVG